MMDRLRSCKKPAAYFVAVWALFEITLQLVAVNANRLTETVLAPLVVCTQPPFTWEGYFLDLFREGRGPVIPDLSSDALHRVHPTRGWALRENHQQERGGVRYTTNEQGFRALFPFEHETDRYTVMILGDSFTFGDGVPDRETWPHILAERFPAIHCLNMAGSGYGLDQMLLTMEEEIARYKPDLVLAAFIDDDLNRALLSFRDYAKPRYRLDQGQLKLTNTPIPSVPETLKTLEKRRDLKPSRLQTANVIRFLQRKSRPVAGVSDVDRTDIRNACPSEGLALNEAIIDRMRVLADQHESTFLLVYLPNQEEIYDPAFKSFGEVFFNQIAQKGNHPSLNLRKPLLDADIPFTPHTHYGRPENTVVAENIRKWILRSDSYSRTLRE